MKRYLSISIFILLLVSACKKNNDKSSQENSSLPSYGNVDLNSVFSKEDNHLKNKDSVTQFLHQYYQKVWEGAHLSGGILVAKGDHILLEKYSGFAQPNNQDPITQNTPLHVASVSKTLTAMAVLKLVQAGKLKLTDPLTKFFPKFPYPGIQVQYLLNQRSGLPKYEHFIDHIDPKAPELQKSFLTNQDVLHLLETYKPELAREPNTGFMYCNTNFALLALIIQKISGMPFPIAMQDIIFKPLKMKNTYVFTEKDLDTAAKSFYNNGTKPVPYDRLDLIYGDKNVFTTPRDLFNFSKALYSPDFLTPELKQMVFTPYSTEKDGVNNYGFGFRMKIFGNGEKLTYHNGWWHGSNAVFAHLLNSKVTIIAIGNKYSRQVYSALALSAIFEDFPAESEKLHKAMTEEDTTKLRTNPANNSIDNLTGD